jgi:hypothetical protein
MRARSTPSTPAVRGGRSPNRLALGDERCEALLIEMGRHVDDAGAQIGIVHKLADGLCAKRP